MQVNDMAIPQPTGAELEVMAVLWEISDHEALKLSQIHQRIQQRRKEHSEPLPALTTISTILRKMVTRGLLIEVRLQNGQVTRVLQSERRSTLFPVKSPQTAYQVACKPKEAVSHLFRILVNSYPTSQRYAALLDVAEVLGLDQDIIRKIEKMLPRV